MNRILKIDKKYWDLIESGIKEYEVRKLNKDFIKSDDVIYFISLDETMLYGKRKVRYKTVTPYAINCSDNFKDYIKTQYKLDYQTKKYINDNYNYEDYLILFALEESK